MNFYFGVDAIQEFGVFCAFWFAVCVLCYGGFGVSVFAISVVLLFSW